MTAFSINTIKTQRVQAFHNECPGTQLFWQHMVAQHLTNTLCFFIYLICQLSVHKGVPDIFSILSRVFGWKEMKNFWFSEGSIDLWMTVKWFNYVIHSFVFHTHLSLSVLQRSGADPSWQWVRGGCTMDMSPVWFNYSNDILFKNCFPKDV